MFNHPIISLIFQIKPKWRHKYNLCLIRLNKCSQEWFPATKSNTQEVHSQITRSCLGSLDTLTHRNLCALDYLDTAPVPCNRSYYLYPPLLKQLATITGRDDVEEHYQSLTRRPQWWLWLSWTTLWKSLLGQLGPVRFSLKYGVSPA